MSDLTGLTAVVTGGNSGLGLAMATGIGRAGARVVIWARDRERSSAAVEALARLGIAAFSVRCDIGEESDVQNAMAETLARAGQVDCLVANAGTAAAAALSDTSLAQWRQVLRTNLDGTFLTCRAAAEHMIERGRGGSLIVVSSLIARYGGAGQIAYATSKSGLIGLGRTLAVELARYRIRCNLLLPGWFATPMNAALQANERFMQATTQRTPVRRWAEPRELEAVAAFLADPALVFHTGNEVVVDGGYSIF